MAPKGEDGSWLRNGSEERTYERQQSDGEGEDCNGCFPRGRKVYSGAPFARLDTHHDAESVKEKLLGAIYCCCEPSADEDLKGRGGVSKQESSSKWEDVDLTSADCCKAPYWRQLARRAKAHVYVRQAPQPSRDDWLNYDPHSYQMNFDDGCRREDFASSLYIDENDDSDSRERAMQSALLKQFAASRAQRVS
jgi:hypothetical protein